MLVKYIGSLVKVICCTKGRGKVGQLTQSVMVVTFCTLSGEHLLPYGH